jgi:hypothetical protein
VDGEAGCAVSGRLGWLAVELVPHPVSLSCPRARAPIGSALHLTIASRFN